MLKIMSDTKPPEPTEDDVIEWLKNHPETFVKHPDLLEFMEPPQTITGKGVADFQSYMIKRLKDDREDILESAREIVETSRTNMNNLSRIHTAILLLLESKNFEDFIHTITMDFVSLLDVDIVTLLVESEGKIVPHINISGVRAVTPGSIESVMGEQTILLQDNIVGHENIYGGGSGLVKSQALMRLSISRDMPSALIAFGSRNPGLFQDGQGTELIAFLGHVVERCLRTWLDIPSQ